MLPVTIYLEVTFRAQIFEKPNNRDEIEDCQGVGRTVRRAIKIHLNQFHVIQMLRNPGTMATPIALPAIKLPAARTLTVDKYKIVTTPKTCK